MSKNIQTLAAAALLPLNDLIVALAALAGPAAPKGKHATKKSAHPKGNLAEKSNVVSLPVTAVSKPAAVFELDSRFRSASFSPGVVCMYEALIVSLESSKYPELSTKEWWSAMALAPNYGRGHRISQGSFNVYRSDKKYLGVLWERVSPEGASPRSAFWRPIPGALDKVKVRR